MISHNNVVKLVMYIIFLQYCCLCSSFFVPPVFCSSSNVQFDEEKVVWIIWKNEKILLAGAWMVEMDCSQHLVSIWHCLVSIPVHYVFYQGLHYEGYTPKQRWKKIVKSFGVEGFVSGHPLLTGACIAHIKRQKLLKKVKAHVSLYLNDCT